MAIKWRKRVRNVIERVEKIQIDALLVTDIMNIRYLTNFSGSSGFLLLTDKEVAFVTDFRYMTQAEEEVSGFDLRIEKEKMPDVVAGLVREFGLKTVGFEAKSLSFDVYKSIAQRLNGTELKPTTSLVEELRMIKDDEEISSIKKSVGIAEDAFTCIMNSLKPGIKEKDIAIALEYELRRRGSGPMPFDMIVASGERAALPHARPSERTFEIGDLIIIDWGAEAEGYNSDISRTVFLHDESDSEKAKIFKVVLDAQREAIEGIKTGIRVSELDGIARNIIKDSGYGERFGHGLGHGIGLSVHEAPHISWQGDGVLDEGMVFTIEPGIYIPGLGGVRIEDMIRVKDGKAEVLTNLPRELIFI